MQKARVEVSEVAEELAAPGGAIERVRTYRIRVTNHSTGEQIVPDFIRVGAPKARSLDVQKWLEKETRGEIRALLGHHAASLPLEVRFQKRFRPLALFARLIVFFVIGLGALAFAICGLTAESEPAQAHEAPKIEQSDADKLIGRLEFDLLLAYRREILHYERDEIQDLLVRETKKGTSLGHQYRVAAIFERAQMLEIREGAVLALRFCAHPKTTPRGRRNVARIAAEEYLRDFTTQELEDLASRLLGEEGVREVRTRMERKLKR